MSLTRLEGILVALFILRLLILIILCGLLLRDYIKGGTVVNISLEPLSYSMLPAITVCSSNLASRQDLGSLPRIKAVDATVDYVVQKQRLIVKNVSLTGGQAIIRSQKMSSCPPGFKMPTSQSACYKFLEDYYPVNANHSDAISRCSVESNSHLAVIRGPADLADISEAATYGLNYLHWMSAIYDDKEGIWMTDIEPSCPLPWSNWMAQVGGPDLNGVRCASTAASDMDYGDTNHVLLCSAMKPVICQLKKWSVCARPSHDVLETFWYQNQSVELEGAIYTLPAGFDIWKLGADQKAVLEAVAVATGLEGAKDELSIQGKGRTATVGLINALNGSEKQRTAENVHYLSNCILLGKPCQENGGHLRSFHMEEYGTCTTLTMDEGIRDSISGNQFEGEWLVMHMAINVSDFLVTTASTGIRLYVHESSDIPMSAVGFNAPVGSDVRVSISGTRYVRRNRIGLRCLKKYPKPEYNIMATPFYSQAGCEIGCYQTKLVRSCGCVDCRRAVDAMDGIAYRSQPCCKPTSQSCVERFLEGFRYKSCRCHQKCHANEYYLASSRAAMESYRPNCDEMWWWRSNVTNETDGCALIQMQESGIIRFFYASTITEVIKESSGQTLAMLTSNFASLLGMLMGASMISLVESAFYVARFGFRRRTFIRKLTLIWPSQRAVKPA